jgi:hypothetical protein
VLQSLIEFLEELERDMISSLATKDAVTLFTFAKVCEGMSCIRSLSVLVCLS